MRKFLFVCLFILATAPCAFAQFAADMGNQATATQDTTIQAKEPFKVKRYFTALKGSDTLKIARMFSGAIVLPGYSQAYNKQYWKIPVLVAGVGAGIYAGSRFQASYKESENDKDLLLRNICYAGAGLFYWGSWLDGIKNYQCDQPVLPARTTLYSALLPGLGQITNGDYWKLPIIYGGLATCGYFYYTNRVQYLRYKVMYNHATANPSQYDGWMTAENIKWYRDTYRRYRDYSIIATALVYLLNVIDANVFAHFQDFDISDDLTFQMEPNVISPITTHYASSVPISGVGLQMRLTF